MRNQRWLPYPLYVIASDDGDTGLIPNDREMKLLAMQIDRQRRAVEDAIRGPKGMAKLEEQRLKNILSLSETYSRLIADLREKATVLPYEILVPSFGEFVDAQEEAREYMGGMESMIIESKFMKNLLAERVRIDGKVLGMAEICDIDPPEIAGKLFLEIQSRAYPDANLIPFWPRLSRSSASES